MSDYDLSLTGAQIDSALNKVHNADTSPINGSGNMVTSDGIFDALASTISASNLATNFTTTNNTTAPSTQAVQNLVNTSPEWGMALGSKETNQSSSSQLYNGSWDITTSSNFGTMTTQNSNTEVVVPQAKYMWFFMIKHAKTNEGTGSATWNIWFEKGDGTDYQHWYRADDYGVEIHHKYNLHGFRLITGNTRFQVRFEDLDEIQPYFFFVRLGT